MSRAAIAVPTFLTPRAGAGERCCPCRSRPMETTYKTGRVFWVKNVGEPVEEGEAVCEVEMDKKIAPVYAPAAGVLAEAAVADGGEVTAGTVLGQIDLA